MGLCATPALTCDAAVLTVVAYRAMQTALSSPKPARPGLRGSDVGAAPYMPAGGGGGQHQCAMDNVKVHCISGRFDTRNDVVHHRWPLHSG